MTDLLAPGPVRFNKLVLRLRGDYQNAHGLAARLVRDELLERYSTTQGPHEDFGEEIFGKDLVDILSPDLYRNINRLLELNRDRGIALLLEEIRSIAAVGYTTNPYFYVVLASIDFVARKTYAGETFYTVLRKQ